MSAVPEVYWDSLAHDTSIEIYDLIDFQCEFEKNENEKENQKIRSGTKFIDAFSDYFTRDGFSKESFCSLDHLDIFTPPAEHLSV
jgi:hypothetical protein